jgi:large subunit ribosomal protein L13
MKTYSSKPTDVSRKWYLIDASTKTLGRLSTEIANLLIGKSKPDYTPHVDGGDYVVVINADQLKVTGDKLNKKVYYRHSQYPGGLKETLLKDKLENDSTDVITHSVRGMLPVNKLRDGRLARLKVYATSEHPHSAQGPVAINQKGEK